VKIQPLADPAIRAVEDGLIRIVPEGWKNNYLGWMRDIKDWCISRQIWWGHQIPAWYCRKCHDDELTATIPDEKWRPPRDAQPLVALTKPTLCPQCKNPELTQDPDVLDTWFSSALWPFSTLGWPEQTEDLKKFYPTSTLVTGLDILFFWVARMIMMGLKFMRGVPFKDVYIHALVRDVEGQKMSKSKGNVIDPLQVMDKYGTDALRFTLAAMASPGRDIKLSEERIEGYRNFANKLWNAARFILMNLEGPKAAAPVAERPVADRWVLSRLHRCIGEVNVSLEAYRFDEAANALYHFIWHEYCDWYVELAKPALAEKDSAQAAHTRTTLVESFETVLRLLHPFMPFITEEIWQAIPHAGESIMDATARRVLDRLHEAAIPHSGKSIMVAPYPTMDGAFINEVIEQETGVVVAVISEVRNIRGVHKAPSFKNLTGIVRVGNEVIERHLKANRPLITKLAGLGDLKVEKMKDKSTEFPTTHQTSGSIVLTPATGSIILTGGQPIEIVIPLPKDSMDIAREITQKEKRLKELTAQLEQDRNKLSNPDFVAKVPPDVLKKTKARHEECRVEHDKLTDELRRLREMTGDA